jgi:hypothetical protein
VTAEDGGQRRRRVVFFGGAKALVDNGRIAKARICAGVDPIAAPDCK